MLPKYTSPLKKQTEVTAREVTNFWTDNPIGRVFSRVDDKGQLTYLTLWINGKQAQASAIASGLRATQEVFERLNIPCVAIFIRSTKMKFILVISFIAGGLMACSPNGQQDTKQQKSAEEAGKSTQIIFECERNEAITVRFFTDSDRAVMTRNNEDIELKQARTASGFLYSNGLNSIRGKGDDLSVLIGRMSPINCRAM